MYDIQNRLPKVAYAVACIAIVLLTLPTTISALPHYLPQYPPAMISNTELEALHFLSRLPSGTVLTPPVNKNPYAPAPRPLYLYESTAYVSAFSAQQVFLEDEVNLTITGYPWPVRRRASEAFFASTDPVSARKFLSENAIRYVYLPDVASVRPVLSETDLGLTKLFENSSTAIWGQP